jgi:hypothetical protein
MTMMTKMLAGIAGVTAVAAAAPATAQYPYAYGSQYGYSSQYANPYGYSAYGAANTSVAAQQCTAAVQNRLYNRGSIGGIIGALLGANTMNQSRVLGVTKVTANNGYVRVRGIASSGRYAYNNYSPYGVGAYGALGYGYQQSADLSFKCDVDYRGYVRDVDINRRY